MSVLRLMRVVCACAAGLWLALPAAQAVVWTVTDIQGDRVDARREKGEDLRIDDQVEIYFMVEGINQPAVKAQGRVASASDHGFSIVLKPESVSGTPQPGDKIRLLRDAPRGRQALPKYKAPRISGLPHAVKEADSSYRPPAGWRQYRNALAVETTGDWMSFRQVPGQFMRVSYYLPRAYVMSPSSFGKSDIGQAGDLELVGLKLVDLQDGQKLFGNAGTEVRRRKLYGREIAWYVETERNKAQGRKENVWIGIPQGRYAICFRFYASKGLENMEAMAEEMLGVVCSAKVF